MKIKSVIQVAAALLLSTLNHQLSTAFAQGPLTPPGAPAPAMKSLDQIEARTPITALPLTIFSSGSYYLTTNLTGTFGSSGITVNSGINDVTIDLNGFSLIGVPGSKDGITIFGSRVAVINGTIRNWGTNGINALGSQNNRFQNVVAANNGATGIDSGSRSLVDSCDTEFNNTYGIAAGGGCIVRNCLANHNPGGGIYCYNSGSIPNSAVITGCAASQNSFGIALGVNSVATENNLLNNTFAGLSMSGNGNRIENNNVNFNYYGIYTIGVTNVIIRNSLTGNTNAAIVGITAGMPVGPVINGTTMATNTNPNVNISY
jgi:hypothetical protein